MTGGRNVVGAGFADMTLEPCSFVTDGLGKDVAPAAVGPV
jgi:hypothetical protein